MNFAKSLLASMAIFAMLSGQSAAQHYVPTEPLNKNVIYEEFTGVKCPNCPDGHVVMAQILAANPGRAFAVAQAPIFALAPLKAVCRCIAQKMARPPGSAW